MPSFQVGVPGTVFNPALRLVEITSSGYTIDDDDLSGNVLLLLNTGTAQNLTIPSGLIRKQPMGILNIGAGLWTILASSTTVNSKGSFLRLNEQGSAATILPMSTSNVYWAIGDLA